ncbi:MAG: universal stress protein [Thermoplasmata archaeon]|nr:universal stress protein [Thermoplasmata archaeon]MCI4359191.1 universal stress protein [Thermoplasmata archaeon]
MYRRLLLPVSEPSLVEPLIRFSSALLDSDGEIRVLHVIPTKTLPELTRQWRASVNLVVPAHEAGAALGVRVDPEVRASTDVAGEILESAETHGTEGIVMTLRGDRRSHSPIFGHIASSILHHAPCDVIVVNRLALTGDPSPRILLPSFSDPAPPKLLRLAEELAVANRGVPIITLTLATRGQGARGSSATRTPRGIPLEHRHSFFSQSLLGSHRRLPELLVHEASRERFGFLLIGEEALHPEGPILTRRVLEDLFRRAPCPVMAVKG